MDCNHDEFDTDSYHARENALIQENMCRLQNLRNVNNSSIFEPLNLPPRLPISTNSQFTSHPLIQSQQNPIQQTILRLSSPAMMNNTGPSQQPSMSNNLTSDFQGQLSPPVLSTQGDFSNSEEHEISDYDEVLIDLVKSYPIIWKVNSRAYKDKEKRNKAWREIATKMKYFDEESLKSRWKNLRDSMTKCLKRIDTKSGSKASKTPVCKCFDQLSFLKDVLSSSPAAVSNISLLNAENSKEIEVVNKRSFNKNISLTETPVTKYEVPKVKPMKRKNEQSQDDVDIMLIDALKRHETPTSNTGKDESSNMLFCKSLAPILDRKARIQIQQLLMELEDSDSE